jgi:hypothetical protein
MYSLALSACVWSGPPTFGTFSPALLGLAFLDYHNDFESFPPGGFTQFPTSSSDLQQRWQWNWNYAILPYMDQLPLYREADPFIIVKTPIKSYYCPARRGPSTPGGP